MDTTEKKPAEKNEKAEDKKLETKANDKNEDKKAPNDHGEGSCCGGCG